MTTWRKHHSLDNSQKHEKQQTATNNGTQPEQENQNMNNIKKPQNTTPQNTPALNLTPSKLNKQTQTYHENGINTKPPKLLPLNEAKQPQNRTLLTQTRIINNEKHAKLTGYGAQYDAKNWIPTREKNDGTQNDAQPSVKTVEENEKSRLLLTDNSDGKSENTRWAPNKKPVENP